MDVSSLPPFPYRDDQEDDSNEDLALGDVRGRLAVLGIVVLLSIWALIVLGFFVYSMSGLGSFGIYIG